MPSYPSAPGWPSQSWARFNGSNQVTQTNSVGAGSYSYDADGRVMYDGNASYTYDAEGRICAGSSSAGRMGYI